MSKTLFEHAQFELRKLGLHLDQDPQSEKILTDTLGLVRKFESQKHTDFTGRWVLEFFDKICNFLPLSPITDDPEEWEEYEDRIKNVASGKEEITRRWMNKRCPSIYSTDGGATFTDMRNGKSGESADHVALAKEWVQQRKDRQAARIKANEPQEAPVQPPADTSLPAGEEAPLQSKSQLKREAIQTEAK